MLNLWVFFQTRAVCAQASDRHILNALDDLPKDLPETFARILRRLSASNLWTSEGYRKMFAIISAALRPLNFVELREALSVEPGDIHWEPGALIHDMQKAIDSCRGLLISDEEHLTVHFTHHSVKKYITTSAKSLTLSTSEQRLLVHQDVAEILCGQICLTYLNFDFFERQIGRVRRESTISPSQLINAHRNSPTAKLISNLALLVLKQKTKTDGRAELDLEKLLKSQRRLMETPEFGAFNAYADEYWHHHCLRALQVDARAVTELRPRNSSASLLLRRICKTQRFDLLDNVHLPNLVDDTSVLLLDIAHTSPGQVSTLQGREERIIDHVPSELLREYGVDIDSLLPHKVDDGDWIQIVRKSPLTWTVISLAAACGHSRLLTSLLSSLKKPFFAYRQEYSNPRYGFAMEYVRAFREASCRCNSEIMHVLVNGGNPLFAHCYRPVVDKGGHDMLHYALMAGDEEVAALLVNTSLNFNFKDHIDNFGCRARRTAALRNANMLRWMAYHVQVELPERFQIESTEEIPQDAIKITVERYSFEDSKEQIEKRRDGFCHYRSAPSIVLGFQGSLVTAGKKHQGYGFSTFKE
ncbi:MAG: hypothetical protein LQ340_004349 [Diploschistes diacapsis]|nr:MAG: hypothetical protein LQ340_004349 [Diploschistes diacapsis]